MCNNKLLFLSLISSNSILLQLWVVCVSCGCLPVCRLYSFWLSVWLLLYLPYFTLFSYLILYSASDLLADISPLPWQKGNTGHREDNEQNKSNIKDHIHSRNELSVCMSMFDNMFVSFYHCNATVCCLSFSHYVEMIHHPTTVHTQLQ